MGQLVLTKSVTTSTPNVNVPFSYTINYNNPSITTDLPSAVITDVVPAAVDYVPGSLVASNPAHIASMNYNAGTRTLTITMVNPLPAGSTGTLNFSAAFPVTTYTNTTASNVATSTSGSGPSTSNTVVVTAQNGVTPPVYSDNLQCGINAPVNVAPGGGVNYGLPWGNLSSSTAANMEMTVAIPPQIVPVEIGSYNFPGTNLSYTMYYKTTLVNTWTAFTFSPLNTNTVGFYNLPASTQVPMAPGEYFTDLRWVFGNVPGNGAFYFEKPGSRPLNLLCTVLTTDRNGNPVMGGGTITICNNMSATINGMPVISNCCTNTPISSTPIFQTLAGKEIMNPQAGYLKNDIIRYRLSLGVEPQTSTNWVRPVLIDMLPPELEYVGNPSITSYGSAVANIGTPTLTQINNYNNTGQTLLKWEWPGYIQPNINYHYVNLDFDTRVRVSATVGQYSNILIIGGDVTATGCPNYVSGDLTFSSITDTDDLDGDGNASETLCTIGRTFNVVIPSAAGLESVKWVKGSLDAAYSKYPAHGNTTPGGLADYKLILTNPGTIPMTSIQIIDILPFIGDVGVIDPQLRLSEWRPFLVGPVVTPSGVTVYYSTQTNPCRDELAGINPMPYPTGCQTAVWSTTPPSDITTVQSLKFDFGSTVLAPGGNLELNWPMRAPLNAPSAGEVAWNSFGYVGARQDNNIALLPSEPIKVGIAVLPPTPASIGNLIWKDANGNGLQDEPASSGINGVRVELWSDGGDNIPGNAGDNFLSFTLTSDLASGLPGYYIFNDLPAGNYYIKFPTSITMSAMSVPLTTVNTSTTTDGNSDASITTGLSAVVHLDPLGAPIEQQNLTIDAGYGSLPPCPVIPCGGITVVKN